MTRYVMYRSIREALPLPLKGDILGISGVDNFKDLMDAAARLVEVHYPEVDIQNLPHADESFDVVISDQVLEHLPRPWQAISETFRVLRPGGLAVHTSCFQNLIHGEGWGDYFRFTPDGLKAMCPAGTEVIACAGWGNRFTNFLRSFGLTWNVPGWGPRRWLATYNEWRAPVVTWIVARKK
jgi:SAM-dependent methyltransferase